MLGYNLQNLSIVDWEFRAGIVAVIVAIAAASWLFRRTLPRWGTRVLCVPLVVAFVGASINAHYGYFPTLGTLLGRTAADQISAGGFAKLEQKYVHHTHGRLGYSHLVRSTPATLPSHGVVLSIVIPSAVSRFAASTGEIYLPPIWFEDPHPRLPVIELLHGSPGSPADWTRGGAADLTADAYAASHHGYAPILVMPSVNGRHWSRDTECVNGPQGNAETYLTVDVRNAVVHMFGARADGAAWAVAGLSEGGSCALQMGLRHPELFSVVGDFSGDDHPWISGGLRKLFWGQTMSQLARAERAYDPRVLLAHWHSTDAPLIFFTSGSSDHVLAKMQRLVLEARRDHIAATLTVLSGGHTFWFWSRSFAITMPWITQRLDVPPHAPLTRKV